MIIKVNRDVLGEPYHMRVGSPNLSRIILANPLMGLNIHTMMTDITTWLTTPGR